jgi:chitinase
MTHIATAFYLPDSSGGFSSGSFDTTSASTVIAAAHAHGVKAIASIGGASTGQLFEAAMNAQSAFLASIQGLLAQGYDGVDIDWEGGTLPLAQEQQLETTLIQALRAASPGTIITVTAGTENQNYPDDLSFYAAIAPVVDQINLMTYGMTGTYIGWESWHSSPLYWNHVSQTPAGIDGTVALYVAAGVPAGKLGVGAGFYGECYSAPVTAPMQAITGSQVLWGEVP